MAKIWPVYDGERPTTGDQCAEVSLEEAVSLFGLKQDQFVSGLAVKPRPGDPDRDTTWAGYRRVVVEIDTEEAAKAKWKAGFYRSKIKPQEAFRRLVQQTIASALGPENVVRVECAKAVDSLGEAALQVTVVLTPDALAHILPASPVKASRQLKKRLREMRAYSTPLIQYATEADLELDDDP